MIAGCIAAIIAVYPILLLIASGNVLGVLLGFLIAMPLVQAAKYGPLVGAWKLVSYREIPVDGSSPFEPLGPQPMGIIMYTPDGYMSAQLSKPVAHSLFRVIGSTAPSRNTGSRRRPTSPTPDRSTSTRTHNPDPLDVRVTVSRLDRPNPATTGETSTEIHFQLGTASPIRSSGQIVNSVLHWRRGGCHWTERPDEPPARHLPIHRMATKGITRMCQGRRVVVTAGVGGIGLAIAAASGGRGTAELSDSSGTGKSRWMPIMNSAG